MSTKKNPLRLNIYLDIEADPEFEYLVAMEQRGYRGFEAIRLMKLGFEYDQILKEEAKSRFLAPPQRPTKTQKQPAQAPQSTPAQQQRKQSPVPANPAPVTSPNVQPAPNANALVDSSSAQRPIVQNMRNQVASQPQRDTVETRQPYQPVRETNVPVSAAPQHQQQRPLVAKPPALDESNMARAASKRSSFLVGVQKNDDVD